MHKSVLKNIMQSANAPKFETITLEEVETVDCFAAFLDETLHMCPPLGMIVRSEANGETVAGYNIPKGTIPFVLIHLLHRNPKHWKDPETFKPQRWMKGSSEFKGSAGMDIR